MKQIAIEVRPYGKEEEEEADKEVDDVPEIWSLPPEPLTQQDPLAWY